jgi:pyruvate/2-oxoglutarate dehydrogenase complex dihydrolipoamide dehydrogenase (E3) component
MNPSRIVIVGAGPVACHYATALAADGVTVTLIARRGEPIRFAERKMLERLADGAVEVLFDREVVDIQTTGEESLCVLADGSAYPADRVLVADEDGARQFGAMAAEGLVMLTKADETVAA